MLRQRNRSDASEVDTGGTRRPTERRGWGPFTGGQLTVIILGMLCAVAFPVGAWAAGAQTVVITDATGSAAHVDPQGDLQTKNNGPITVNGTVVAPVAASSALFRSSVVNVGFASAGGSQPCVKVVDSTKPYPFGGGGPTPHAEIVTELSFSEITFKFGNGIGLHRSPTCSDPAVKEYVFPNATTATGLQQSSFQTTFPSGLAIPAGQALYATPFDTGGSVSVSATGYLVSAGSVPANG